jgi:hypothetical protein
MEPFVSESTSEGREPEGVEPEGVEPRPRASLTYYISSCTSSLERKYIIKGEERRKPKGKERKGEERRLGCYLLFGGLFSKVV